RMAAIVAEANKLMDLQGFFSQLPLCYEDWGTVTVRPRSLRFQAVLQRVRGLTSPGVLQLLNLAVGFLEPGECYAEVGSFQGATLIGALLDHPHARAHAVDNFSEFDPSGRNLSILNQNLSTFGLERQVSLHNQHFEQFFLERQTPLSPLGVYFYDGA